MVKKMMKHKSVLVLRESINCDHAGSKGLSFSLFDDIGLYTVTMEELCILIEIAMKNRNEPAPIYAPIFYSGAKMLLGKLRALFFDQRTDSTLDIAEFLNTLMSHKNRVSILPLQKHFSCILLHRCDRKDQIGA